MLGIDTSQGMIDAAMPKERNNLRFQRLDINDLDFAEQFDVLFSNAALHWIKGHQRLLKNVCRALRTGGRRRFNFAGDGNCSNLSFVVRDAIRQEEFRSLFTGFERPCCMSLAIRLKNWLGG